VASEGPWRQTTLLTAIVRSGGVNRSEQLLAQLCDKAFLPLWCYPNVFRAKAKELVDVLVVFGDDVILFSDKARSFPNTGDLNLDWNRWKSSSLDDSVRQLRRAERWLRQRPSEVYLDPKCTTRFPLPINPNGRFHRVLVARNATVRCKEARGGTGSLMIHGPAIPRALAGLAPFEVFLSEYDDFVHVLDDVTLPIVLRELDTATDFLEYLTHKEEAFRKGHIRTSFGEEETLALFLVSTLEWSRGLAQHRFPDPPEGNTFIIDKGHWAKLHGRTEYKDRKRADQISYLWDSILRSFGEQVHGGEAPNPFNSPFADLEEIGRHLASEPRIGRRLLAASLVDAYMRVPQGHSSNRTILSRHHPLLAYVFTFVPRLDGDDAEYREFRRNYALLYAFHSLRRAPRLQTIVAIATEGDRAAQNSYDFLLVKRSAFDEELVSILDDAVQEYGWHSDIRDLEQKPFWNEEYPRITKRRSTMPKWRSSKKARKESRRAERTARRKNQH
jgi:hypothetical protein